MTKKNTIFVTNIPTPYRLSMFNQLSEYAEEAKTDFQVYFMNKTEYNRNWKTESEIRFKNKIWDMQQLLINNVYFRFSITYVFSSIKNSNHLILGASWNDLNVITIAVLKKIGLIKNKISFWTEANELTVGAKKKSWFKHHLRKFILSAADKHYFIPGKMSEITLKNWGIDIKNKVVYLPNLPENKFDQNIGAWLGSNNSMPVYTIVARLDEKTKGILNFMNAIGLGRLKKIKLNIIGSGADKSHYEDFITQNDLLGNVFLLGEKSPDQIIEILKVTDVFVLPSFSDSSPLSLVEACKIGLPLLISNHCGNHYECLESGKNGYSFNPNKQNEIQASFDKILTDKEKWSDFSKKSIELANQNFNSAAALKKLAMHL